MNLREILQKQIQLNNGITHTKLMMNAMSIVGVTKYTVSEYNIAIEELLKDREILRILFTDPESPTGTKSVLFVKGTKFLNLLEMQDVETKRTSEVELARKSSSDI